MAVRDYAEAALMPVIEPFAKTYAAHKVQRLYGFWICWHVTGGHDAMVQGGWSRASVYRQAAEFEQVFKMTVEDAWPEIVEFMTRGVKNNGEG